jgi:putative sigma-54 modulation protein
MFYFRIYILIGSYLMPSKITIHGHHLEVTQALHDHVHEHLGKAVRHFDQMQRVSVNMRVERLVHTVDVTVHMPNKDIHCEAEAANMYAAIDAVCLKLDRVILKHKEQLRDHRSEPLKHYDDLPLVA